MITNHFFPLKITKKATQAIQNIRQNKNIDAKYALRIGVKGAGCSKDDFVLGFDLQKENDRLYDYLSIKVIIDKAQVMYLFGVELDYEVQSDGTSGFLFKKE